jgi:hypothetical protein
LIFGSIINILFNQRNHFTFLLILFFSWTKAKATLGSGDLRLAVQLPEREDINEWLAVNTVDFFNQINLLYGSITEFCTPKSCPVMAAGPKYEYLWADGAKIKRPIKVPHTHTHTPHTHAPHTHARMVA